MKTYQDYKQNQRAAMRLLSDYGFYAFSDEQFEQGLSEIGAKRGDVVAYDFGFYCLRSRSGDVELLLDSLDDQLDFLLSDKKFLFEALVYELNNHEYIVNYDVQEALSSLNLDMSTVDRAVLKKAIDHVIGQSLPF